MKPSKFIQSKLLNLLIVGLVIAFLTFYLGLGLISVATFNIIIIILVIVTISNMLIEYYNFKRMFRRLNFELVQLDQKFLLGELANQNNGYVESQILSIIDRISKDQYELNKQLKIANDDLINDQVFWVHELKQCISLLEGEQLSVKQLGYVRQINLKLTEILNIGTINGTSNTIKLDKYDISEIINDQISYLAPLLISGNIDVQMNINNSLVVTDSNLFKFIVSQLILNSIKYKRDNSEISFDIEDSSSGTKLIITDNGIGIDNHDLPYIFNKGYRGDNARDTEVASGYGLYYVKQVADKLNIDVKIESKRNYYTKVIVTIPQFNRN